MIGHRGGRYRDGRMVHGEGPPSKDWGACVQCSRSSSSSSEARRTCFSTATQAIDLLLSLQMLAEGVSKIYAAKSSTYRFNGCSGLHLTVNPLHPHPHLESPSRHGRQFPLKPTSTLMSWLTGRQGRALPSLRKPQTPPSLCPRRPQVN